MVILTEIPEEVIEHHWNVIREAIVRVVKEGIEQIGDKRRQKDEDGEKSGGHLENE